MILFSCVWACFLAIAQPGGGAGPEAAPVATPVGFERMHQVEWAGARSISAAPNGAVVVATGDEGVRAWRVLPTGELEERWTASPERLGAGEGWRTVCVAVSPNARHAAVTMRPAEPWAEAGRVVVVESASGRVVWSGTTGYGPRELAWLENSSGFVVADEGPFGVERGEAPEGAEPSPDGSPAQGPILSVIDPPGSVTLVRAARGSWDDVDRTTLPLSNEHIEPERPGAGPSGRIVRLHPMNAVVPELDMEPAGVATLGRIAYVLLPANNAVVSVDVIAKTIGSIRPLGSFVQTLDASSDDGGIRIDKRLRAMPMPTALALFRDASGRAIMATANTGSLRGDLRDPGHPFQDHAPLLELLEQDFLAEVLANIPAVRDPADLGSLRVCTFFGTEREQGLLRPHALGARSVTAWDGTSLERYSDTGSAFEQAIAEQDPARFNAFPEDPETPDASSTTTGPQPTSIDVISVGGRLLALSAFRNPGGFGVTDLTVRSAARLVGLKVTAAEGGLGSADAAWVRWGGSWLIATAHETGGFVTVHLLDMAPADEPREEPED
ncbi:MAG: hypothetical protein EA378_08765 [Phycisphaerales bacterium]|nr:MAG: hypothetical protein EA378_08765 [Phycisphaerales bacterium]